MFIDFKKYKYIETFLKGFILLEVVRRTIELLPNIQATKKTITILFGTWQGEMENFV